MFGIIGVGALLVFPTVALIAGLFAIALGAWGRRGTPSSETAANVGLFPERSRWWGCCSSSSSSATSEVGVTRCRSSSADGHLPIDRHGYPAARRSCRAPSGTFAGQRTSSVSAWSFGLPGDRRVDADRRASGRVSDALRGPLPLVERPPSPEGEPGQDAHERCDPKWECCITEHDDRRHRLDRVTWPVRDREDDGRSDPKADPDEEGTRQDRDRCRQVAPFPCLHDADANRPRQPGKQLRCPAWPTACSSMSRALRIGRTSR